MVVAGDYKRAVIEEAALLKPPHERPDLTVGIGEDLPVPALPGLWIEVGDVG